MILKSSFSQSFSEPVSSNRLSVPSHSRYPNCIHLDVEQQLKLNYRVTRLLKLNSYARKTIGFLYAIQHGAKIIYETDDDNSPTKGKMSSILLVTRTRSLFLARNVFLLVHRLGLYIFNPIEFEMFVS